VQAAPERYGAYRVFEQLGVGGMATVHRAELDTKEGVRQVALKRMMPTMQREMIALFQDEARLLGYLKHQNIAETFDSGRVFGTYFIAMEYIKGPTLRKLVEHCGQTVGAVAHPVTLEIAAQLCDALDYAHNMVDENGTPLGIVHRDITPANIILSDSGLVKLIDFGLAKTKVSSENTKAGVIKGKFGYIAPEYLDGKLDHRADLWAVGIIMYELLTTRRLFDSNDVFETMMRIRNMPIPRPSLGNPRVTPELDDVVMTALERDPDRRWQSAADMRDELRAVIDRTNENLTPVQVHEWTEWVLSLQPGTEASGLAQLRKMAPPLPTPERPSQVVFMPTNIGDDDRTIAAPLIIPDEERRKELVFLICFYAWAVLTAAALLWKLFR
jgi:serine/threonine-protein kinase